MPRFAAIDVGTNSVLLLVADRQSDGRFAPVLERAEITRLGRGVDQSKRLAPEAIEETVQVLEGYVADARRLGAEGIAATATSAARDSANGGDFLRAAQSRAGLEVEIISGTEEAQLCFASVWADFGREGPLVVVDIGGGSTEFIFSDASGALTFRHSFDVGSVRLTERLVTTDPLSLTERTTLCALLDSTFSDLPPPAKGFQLVAVAGTATTVCAVARAIEPYEPAKVHGAQMPMGELTAAVDRLCSTPLAARRKLPGLQPKRADVIPAGALVLEAAARRLGVDSVRISDRGLRWGLLADRFGSV